MSDSCSSPGLGRREFLTAAGALTAHLCGSGSAVFGVTPDRRTAERIASRLQDRYPFAAACETVVAARSLQMEAAA